MLYLTLSRWSFYLPREVNTETVEASPMVKLVTEALTGIHEADIVMATRTTAEQRAEEEVPVPEPRHLQAGVVMEAA